MTDRCPAAHHFPDHPHRAQRCVREAGHDELHETEPNEVGEYWGWESKPVVERKPVKAWGTRAATPLVQEAC